MSPLPEGLQAEPSALVTAARVALALWALPLLVASRRLPRFTAGSFFLPLATAVAWGLFASTSYPLALGAAWVLFAFVMLFHAFLPRLAMAVACSWVFLAVYGGHLYFSGGFGINRTLAVGLLVAGAALGAVFPRFALAVLGPEIAALLLVAALPLRANFWWPLSVAAGGLALQTLLLPALRPRRIGRGGPPPPTVPEKRRAWTGSLGWAAALLLAILVCVALLAPAIVPGPPSRSERLASLRKSGALGRPGLLWSAEDAFYVSGRPLTVSVAGPYTPLLNRLLLPILGRSPAGAIAGLRAVKDASETDAMRRAALVTSKAFEEVAPLIKPGISERDIEEAILASFERNGADGIAFKCIVGSGRNATLPHYDANRSVMTRGLVVIDIGCTVDHYASDMTRTFPVSGALTGPERKLLETVIAAGDAARARLKPGVTQSELDSAARKVIKDAGFGDYFTHGLGHPVGLDVHDSWIGGPLKAGNVITIEPGLYIPAGSKAEAKYWDLGVRVEDTYLVTPDGYEELTRYPRMPPEPAAPIPSEPAGAGGPPSAPQTSGTQPTP